MLQDLRLLTFNSLSIALQVHVLEHFSITQQKYTHNGFAIVPSRQSYILHTPIRLATKIPSPLVLYLLSEMHLVRSKLQFSVLSTQLSSSLLIRSLCLGSLEIANDDDGDESNNNKDGNDNENDDDNDGDNNDLDDDLNDGNTKGNESGSEDGENVGAIAGGVVGGVVVLSVAGFLIWWLFRRQRQKYRDLLDATTRPEPVLKAEMPSTNTVNSPHTPSQGIVPTSTTLNELYGESTIPQTATTHMLSSDNVAGTYKQTG